MMKVQWKDEAVHPEGVISTKKNADLILIHTQQGILEVSGWMDGAISITPRKGYLNVEVPRTNTLRLSIKER